MASIFSGKAGRNAAIWTADYLEKSQKKIDDAIKAGETKQIGAIDTGEGTTLKQLESGFKGARNAYRAARKSFSPYVQTGQKAFGQYADATGVNGQEGYDRSEGNFRASPGYEWQVDQATDAVARKASATGSLASGNTMTEIQDRASHLADQEWDDYLDRLEGVSQVGYDATGKQAGITTAIGDLWTQRGKDKASVYDSNAKSRAAIYGDTTALGVNSLAQTSGAIADVGYKGMMAGQEAAGNRFGALMGGLTLGAKLLGGIAGAPVAGGGSVGGNMFSKWLG
jgi:hypothetical protein